MRRRANILTAVEQKKKKKTKLRLNGERERGNPESSTHAVTTRLNAERKTLVCRIYDGSIRGSEGKKKKKT